MTRTLPDLDERRRCFIEASPLRTQPPHVGRIDWQVSEKEVVTMRKNVRRAAVLASVAAVAIFVPTEVALAATSDPSPGPNSNPAATCTHDRDQDRLRLRDGTGSMHEQRVTSNDPASGHRSGPQDGSGQRADRPLDGTGFQWGRAA